MISLNPKKEKKLKEFSNSKKLITRKVRFKKIEEETKRGAGRRLKRRNKSLKRKKKVCKKQQCTEHWLTVLTLHIYLFPPSMRAKFDGPQGSG